MDRPDFRQALKQADADRRRIGVPPDTVARVRARLLERAGSHRQRAARGSTWVWSLGTAVAAMLLLLLRLFTSAPEPTTDGVATTAGPADIVAVNDGLSVIGGGEVLDSARGLHIRVPRGRSAVLLQSLEGVRLLEGEIEVEVQKRPPVLSTRILVSGGAIEVIGTLLSITESGTAGELLLREGVVAFHYTDGGVRLLGPGDRHVWPPASPPPSEPPARVTKHAGADGSRVPAARHAPHPQLKPAQLKPVAMESALPVDVERLLERVMRLRSLARFEDAVSVIEQALEAESRREVRLLLRYELASILTYQLEVPARACPHWRTLLDEDPQGRFSDGARRELASCP